MNTTENELLLYLKKYPKETFEKLLELDIEDDDLKQTLERLSQKGAVKLTTKKIKHAELTEEGKKDLIDFPEEILLKELLIRKEIARGGIKDSIALNWAKRNGWIVIKSDVVEISKEGLKVAKSTVYNQKSILKEVSTAAKEKQSEVIEKNPEIIKILEKRRLLALKELKKIIDVEITPLGRKLLEIPKSEEINRLSPEIIKSGFWKSTSFRKYDVSLKIPQEYEGRKHILRMGIDTITRILLEMGFKEMEGPMVDAEFFVNDCLFMPQDHPARTHWDQFSLKRPKTIKNLPEELVKKVKIVHENGGNTGSTGWGYRWDEKIAKKLVLRGHTTSLTAHYLSKYKTPPNRFFVIGKVFRNDAIDRVHLIEFYHIEGWVMDNNLTVRDLMGTFKEFYSKIGIEDIKFKPTFNPYTEPSFEIYGKHPKSKKWLEIGNSGMFREEMLQPFGISANVIAWGLALERTLMLLYNFDDIRNLHGALCDIDFLRNAPMIWQY